ncbi:MAG: hypothetical protein EPO24_09355 [Bacteroidetes bacterium]|nr:MAG: hypothetical protein EPO24_09355 [Bacteroidota bacterium]
MNQNRKLKAFYVTIVSCLLIVAVAIVKGVSLTGDNIVAIVTILAAVGGGFFGANFGEHYAKSKTPGASQTTSS